MQIAIGLPVEEYAEFNEPLSNGRTFLHHDLQQVVVVLHVTALEGVKEMRDRGVLRCDRNLHAALRHDAVGIRSESNRPVCTRPIVRVIPMNQLVSVGGRELWDGLLAASISRLMNNLLECVNIHGFAFGATLNP